MKRRDFLSLLLLGLAVPLAMAQFQSLPGYMDADYYFGGGLQLVKGNGFTEPYLWNYLSDPQGLPTPSHAYWMPLASLVAAAGMWITGQATFASARIGFILLAALVPPLTCLLAFRLTSNRSLSLLSGLLACFPIYYAPFLPVTDNYAIYMLLGISFFLLFPSPDPGRVGRGAGRFFLLGVLSALMTLARSDGLLWLGLSLLVAFWYARIYRPISQSAACSSFILYLSSLILPIFLGFILIMSPWYARNLQAFGSLMAPGGTRTLWLTDYNDTFLHPASQLTAQRWLASGWEAILRARLEALKWNLLNAIAAQGGIFLFPFIIAGLWKLRRDARILFAALAWSLVLAAMVLVFPFAGQRGAFFHAGAALQPLWWAAAPVGLDAGVTWIRKRGWLDDRAFAIFRASLVGLALLLTAAIFLVRVLPGWEREDGVYLGMNELLARSNAPDGAVVIVRNPPGFYLVTGHPAIAVPMGGPESLLAVAGQYNARLIVVEASRVDPALYGFQLDQYPFRYVGESDGNLLYEILP